MMCCNFVMFDVPIYRVYTLVVNCFASKTTMYIIAREARMIFHDRAPYNEQWRDNERDVHCWSLLKKLIP